jgi:formamidopyrimidine-DNA glycosylase
MGRIVIQYLQEAKKGTKKSSQCDRAKGKGMPELPEVETVVRDLIPLLTSKTIVKVEVPGKKLRRPWNPQWSQLLEKQTIETVARRGKWIIISLRSNLQLVIHLGMTGQLCVFNQKTPRQSHTNLVFTLDHSADELRFRDIRRFGSADLFVSQEALKEFFVARELGPEPFNIPQDYWLDSLAKSSRNLKAFLLDQKNITGVGNIYADESLYKSALNPSRKAQSLSKKEALLLAKCVGEVLGKAIENRGSTIKDYVGGSGLMGGYQDEFQAYGRTGEPCGKCERPIKKIVLAGRSTHFCPNCQPKKPRSR